MRTHHPIRFARKDAESILERFMAEDLEVFPCGSWRRRLETVGDLDIVVLGEIDATTLYHRTGAIDLVEMKRVHLFYEVNKRRFEVEITTTTPEKLGAALLHCTGSAKWNHNLRQKAIQKGWRLSENGLYNGDTLIHAETEGGILEALEVPWTHPELR